MPEGYHVVLFSIEAIMASLSSEGLCWFADLTAPDQYYVLPLVLGVSNLLNIEVCFVHVLVVKPMCLHITHTAKPQKNFHFITQLPGKGLSTF